MRSISEGPIKSGQRAGVHRARVTGALLGTALALLLLSSCSFRGSDAGSDGGEQGRNGPLAEPAGIAASVIHSDGTEDSRILVPSGSSGALATSKPIVLPLPIPDQLRLRFPLRSWSGLKTSGFILFGTEVREVNVIAEVEAPGETGANKQGVISIEGLKGVIPSQPGVEAKVALELRTDDVTEKYDIYLRTPAAAPTLRETVLPLNAMEPIYVSAAAVLVPIKVYELHNSAKWPIDLSVKAALNARTVRQIKTVSHSQGNCQTDFSEALTARVYSERLMLLPENFSNSQVTRFLNEPFATVRGRINSLQVDRWTLYLVTNPTEPRFANLGREWVGPTQNLSPACVPTTCKRKSLGCWRGVGMNGPVLPCGSGSVADGYYCILTVTCDRAGNCGNCAFKPDRQVWGGCVEHYIDPGPGIPFNDYTQVMGAYLEEADDLGKIVVDYGDTTVVTDVQRGSLSIKKPNDVLFGEVKPDVKPEAESQ